MMPVYSFWIKERDNPQLGVYYVPCGQMSKTSAKRAEKTLYGYSRMIEYRTEEEYKQAIEILKANGENVHDGGTACSR